MAKVKTTVGVTAGIFNGEGKLLLRRRTEHDSITGIDYAGNWELPVVAVQETEKESIRYDYLSLELVRGVEAETGFKIILNEPMPAFYPVMFKGPQGYDLAMITVIVSWFVPQVELKAVTKFVSLDELNQLAREFISLTDAKKQGLPEAKGLLSGFGKRQHCLALKALSIAPVGEEIKRVRAKETLIEIQKNWS